jgi:hypothetical protein
MVYSQGHNKKPHKILEAVIIDGTLPAYDIYDRLCAAVDAGGEVEERNVTYKFSSAHGEHPRRLTPDGIKEIWSEFQTLISSPRRSKEVTVFIQNLVSILRCNGTIVLICYRMLITSPSQWDQTLGPKRGERTAHTQKI